MKYIKMFNENINSSDIDAICEKYYIKNYNINDDGTIDVEGDVDLSNEQLKVLPLKFRNVNGNFNCDHNQLTNLIGSPQYVGGFFNCGNNQLTSLEGAPQYVESGFFCGVNQLTNLIGSPQRVGGSFSCIYNNLTSLEGCPKKVYGKFWCEGNKLKNIDHLPKKYKELIINGNPINKILNLFTKSEKYGWISNTKENKELIMEFIDREIIQHDILLVNRLVEFLDDIDKPKSREELIELLKNDYTIR